jgi:hypothetical protein
MESDLELFAGRPGFPEDPPVLPKAGWPTVMVTNGDGEMSVNG